MRFRASKGVAGLAAFVMAATLLALVPTAPASAGVAFSDGFETGDLARWTSSSGVLVQQDQVFEGAFAARATSTAGTAAYVYKTLPSALSEIFYDGRFEFVSVGNNNVSVVRFRTAATGAIFSMLRRNDGSLMYYNEVTGSSVIGPIISTGWHELGVHAVIAGTASRIEVSLDGAAVPSMTKTDSLGATAIGRVYIGEPATARTFDLALDSIVLSDSIDTVAPSTPTSLAAAASGLTRVDLSWNPSTDNVGVAGYTVYRDGAQIATLPATATAYSDTTVSPGHSYSYTVQAVDGAGNRSSQSTAAVASTPADTVSPSTPGSLTAIAISATRVDLAWTASTDNVGVTGYTVFRNGSLLTTLGAAARSFSDTTASPATNYGYAVDAFDASGNHSPASGLTNVTTPSLPDTLAPSKPANLTATAGSPTSVALSWDASTDNVGVTGYTVYRGGSMLTTVTGTSYTDSSAQPSTTYSYAVDAFDAAGNHSPVSTAASATTPAIPDTTAPSVPGNVTATASGPSSVIVAWSASTDNVGVSGYAIYRDGASIAVVNGSPTAYVDTTTTSGTTYTYALDAFDAAGNRSARSTGVPVTTPASGDTTPPSVPQNLSAVAAVQGGVALSWSPSTDNVGVSGYTVYRNGFTIASVGGSTPSYVDASAASSTTYSYSVDAFDASANRSAQSTSVPITTPGVLFNDGFESGNMSQWTQTSGVVAQPAQKYTGSWAGRATTDGSTPAYAQRTLSIARPEIYYDGRIDVLSQANATVSLVRLRTVLGGSIMSVFRNAANKLAVYNEVTGGTTTVSTQLTAGTWHELELHALVNGASGLVEMWLDGALVYAKTDNLGTTGVGRLYIGDPSAGRAFDFVYDDQQLTTASDVAAPSIPTGVVATAIGPHRVNITWNASSDNVGVTGYTISRGGVVLGSTGPNALAWTDATASGASTYGYTVAAFDQAANRSAPSATISATTPPGATGDPVIAAAGDIACDPADPNYNNGLGNVNGCRQRATSDVIFNNPNISTVLSLGDQQYEDGTLAKFNASFDPTWGRLMSMLRPVAGNHEYLSAGAAGYYAYFGARAGDPAKGYYSFNIGAWHVVALNGECSFVGGCQAGSAQETWLAADLAANPAACTLAYWHEPRFSSGRDGSLVQYSAFWNDLYNSGAEIVLNGHDHDYERFAPQDPNQVPTPTGLREFVVGSGGAEATPPSTPALNSQAFSNNAFGVLQLTLHANSYDWQFLPAAGTTFADSGTGTCH